MATYSGTAYGMHHAREGTIDANIQAAEEVSPSLSV
jgi:hypothetical protein